MVTYISFNEGNHCGFCHRSFMRPVICFRWRKRYALKQWTLAFYLPVGPEGGERKKGAQRRNARAKWDKEEEETKARERERSRKGGYSVPFLVKGEVVAVSMHHVVISISNYNPKPPTLTQRARVFPIERRMRTMIHSIYTLYCSICATNYDITF